MKRERGFSLLELMVALVVMLLIVGATLKGLTDAIHANEAVTLLADMQENLRAGMNYMVHDLVQAGEGIPAGGITIPHSAGGASAVTRPSPPTLAYLFPATYTTLPAITPGASQGLPTATPNAAGAILSGPNTDFITIMYADNTLLDNSVNCAGVGCPLNQNPIYLAPNVGPPPVAGCAGSITAPGGTVVLDPACFNMPTDNTRIQAGDLIMFQNALGNAIQTVTAVVGQTLTFAGGDAFALNNSAQPNGTIVNIQNGIPSPGGPYPPTTATRIMMITYYLDTNANPLRPQLMRQVNFRAAQPVGEVLEDLGISYDLNNAVSAYPAGPQDAPAPILPDTPNQIRKVNLFLAARSEAPFSQLSNVQIDQGSFQYLRNNLSTQVSVQSLAFFNEYQ
jgi:prepilin-type N-terminal cleavage/methylation domain-containing protein